VAEHAHAQSAAGGGGDEQGGVESGIRLGGLPTAGIDLVVVGQGRGDLGGGAGGGEMQCRVALGAWQLAADGGAQRAGAGVEIGVPAVRGRVVPVAERVEPGGAPAGGGEAGEQAWPGGPVRVERIEAQGGVGGTGSAPGARIGWNRQL
jgi:hypothetical protein